MKINYPTKTHSTSNGGTITEECRDGGSPVAGWEIQSKSGGTGKVHYNNNDDDDFFHVACHIDQNLKDKIEKGEFIDLERLLLKGRAGHKLHDENRLELVTKDGMAYFTPANDKAKITGIRTWEQAFRVYVAIYSKAQPSRASEIWQYIYVINLVASSYAWENVAFYDFTFRQLMSERPDKRWSKTYMQGWNLAMTDPIMKHSSGGKVMTSAQNSSGSSGMVKSWCV